MNSRILRLTLRNIKSIEVARINPKDNTIVLAGKNGNGKSTFLRGIEWGLAGEKGIPRDAVKKGEKNAEIEIDFGEFKLVRRFRGEKTTLSVVGKNGNKISSPQTFLNSITSSIAFNPMLFLKSKKSEQVKMLQNALRLDFEAYNREIEELKGGRLEIGRELNMSKGQLREYDDIKDDEETKVIDVEAIYKRIGEIESSKQDFETREKAYNFALRQRDDIHKRKEKRGQAIVELQEKIYQIEKLIEEHQKERMALEAGEDEAERRLQQAAQNRVGFESYEEEKNLRNELKMAALQGKENERKKQKQRIKKKIKDLDDEYDKKTESIRKVEMQKAEDIRNAKFPVEGVEFSEEGVELNGIPIENASTAEQMKVSLAIAMAMKSQLKIILIEDGSLLDDDSMEEVKKFAKEKDVQVWIERVANEKDDNAIFIEDGHIV